MIRLAWVDPRERPRPVAWFELRDARTGRALGTFLDLPDARAYIRRRPPTELFTLVLFFNGRASARWTCRSAFGGQIKSKAEFIRGD